MAICVNGGRAGCYPIYKKKRKYLGTLVRAHRDAATGAGKHTAAEAKVTPKKPKKMSFPTGNRTPVYRELHGCNLEANLGEPVDDRR